MIVQAVEAAVEEEGWKMVVLLRLSPVIPFALLNYMLSLTAISFFDYTWASALGIIPGAFSVLSPPNLEEHLRKRAELCDGLPKRYIEVQKKKRLGSPKQQHMHR